MRTPLLRRLLLAAGALALALGVWGAAQAQGGYSLAWWTLDGGGGASSGGAYTLRGTSAQADAGRLGGGAYTLRGGFWQPGAAPAAPAPAPKTRVYLPLALRPGDKPALAALPDLVVQAVHTDGGRLEVVIANIGDGAVTTPFWVDLAIAPARTPAAPNDTWGIVGQRGLAWAVLTPLAAGERLTLTVGDRFYRAGESEWGGAIAAGTPLAAHVDSADTRTTYGGVLETHERAEGAYNNVLTTAATAELTPPTSTSAAPELAIDAALPTRPR